jgi:hypothetical protein
LIVSTAACGRQNVVETAPTATLEPVARNEPVPVLDIPHGFEKDVLPTSDVTITVVDSGAEPRRSVHYSPSPGTVEVLTIELDTVADGRGFRFVATAEVEIVSVDERWIAFRTKWTAGKRLRSPQEWNVGAEIKRLELAVGTMWAGVVDRHGVSGPRERVQDKYVAGFVRSIPFPFVSSAPLPREPIGAGAKWIATTKYADHSVITDAEVVEWKGDRLVIQEVRRLAGSDETGEGKARVVVELSRLNVERRSEWTLIAPSVGVSRQRRDVVGVGVTRR